MNHYIIIKIKKEIPAVMDYLTAQAVNVTSALNIKML